QMGRRSEGDISGGNPRNQRLDSRDARSAGGLKSAVDTSVISAIWTAQPNLAEAKTLLTSALEHGALIVCGIVYAELLAHPRTDPALAEMFLADVGIQIDSAMSQAVWHEAGLRYRKYSERRRQSKTPV